MSARFHARRHVPRLVRSLGGNLFTLREDKELIAEVIAIKHRAAGECRNPGTVKRESMRVTR